jgi:hypothetical protein
MRETIKNDQTLREKKIGRKCCTGEGAWHSHHVQKPVAHLKDPFFQKSRPRCVLGRVFKRSSGVPIERAVGDAKGNGAWN